MLPYPDRCPICGKPLPSENNLRVWGAYMLGGTVLGGFVGAAFLPLLGFRSGGIAAGSKAASWQSDLDEVKAGSAFATLQSLGATNRGTLLFGTAGAGIGLLTTLAGTAGFCECHKANTDATSGLATLSHR